MENRIGFGKRLVALLLDCVIVTVVGFVAGGPIGGMLGLAGGAALGGDAGSAALGGAIGAVLGMIAAIYVISLVYSLVEAFTGYTLGKFILGIRIASESGAAAPTSQLLTRYAVKYSGQILGVLGAFLGSPGIAKLGQLAGFIIFVGCFFALSSTRQALHDRVAKTAVYPRAMVK